MGLLLVMVGGEPKGCWRWLVVNRRGVFFWWWFVYGRVGFWWWSVYGRVVSGKPVWCFDIVVGE